MELGHRLVQVPRGVSASASRRRESGVTASPSRKLNGNATAGYASPKQQQQQQQQQQAVLGQKLEYGKRPALPRSSSFELHNLGVPQQQYQHHPQTKEVDVRSFSRRSSAAVSVDTPLPASNLAPGETNRGGDGSEERSYENDGFAGWRFHKKTPPSQHQQQQPQPQQHPEGGHFMGRPRPRPSSAQESPATAPLIRRSATAGNGLGNGRLSKSDAVQVTPMLPLLAPDDDAHERYHSRYNGEDHRHQQHQRHHTNRQPANGTTNNLPATGTEQEAAAVVAAASASAAAAVAAATAPNRTACPSASTTTGSLTKPTSKSHPFSSKTAHHLERETDVTYAQPTRSPSHDNREHGGGRPGGATPHSRTGTDKSMAVAAGGGGNGGGKTAGGHKSVTPQSFGFDAEAGARLIVGRAPPVPIASKSSSGANLAGSSGHELSRQASCRSTHELSAPRITNLAPPSMAYEPAGWRSCGGTIPSGGGVTDDSGVTDSGGDTATGGMMTGDGGVAANVGVISRCGVTPNSGVTANGGSGCIRHTENEKDAGRISINDQKNRGGCCAGGEERKGGGREEGGGARHNHGVNMRYQNGDSEGATTPYDTVGDTATIRIPARGDVSVSSEHRQVAHHRDSATVSGNSHHPHHPQQQQKQQQQKQQRQQQHQRKGRRVEEGGPDVGEDRGTLLPGPEGCVEVRELEEGVLVVRRTWHEKKQSPERLNLHRRQLKSCPLVQGDSRLRLLNYQNNLISKITNLANLPNLIFLDLYNNLIDTLEGPLSTMSALRVVMVGKNRIEKISNLDRLRKLDVLDLHSNDIQDMEGLSSLQDLRVLNLAGNCLRTVENVSCLTSLTELNLRRNSIEKVTELDALPKLQRLFLSNNKIHTFEECRCIFSVESLLELSLDGNPVAGQNGLGSSYRRYILQHLPGLHHLDLKRVTNHDQAFPLEPHNPATNANNLPARHPHTKSISLAALGSISPTTYSVHKNGNHSKNNSNVVNKSNNFSDSKNNSSSNNNSYGNNNTSSSNNNSDNHYSRNNSYDSGAGGGGGLPVLPNTDSGMHQQQQQQQQRRQQQHRRKGPGVSSAPSAMGYPYNWPPSEKSRHTNSADARRPRTSDPGAARPCPSSSGGGGSASHSQGSSRSDQQKAGFQEGAPDPGFVSGMRAVSGENRPDALKGVASKGDMGGGPGVISEGRCEGGGAAEPVKVGRGERERRALKERAEAIEAARECWENRIRRSTTSRARNRHGREGANTSIGNATHHTGHPASPPTLTPTFSPKKSRGRFNSSPGSPTPPLKPNSAIRETISTVGSRAVTVNSGDRSRDRGGGGRSRVSRGVGYFELEQRFGKETVGSLGGAADSGAGIGPGITLKVYGDVWRWLGDPKVCSLKEQVVEARFSLVHAASVARKAAAIAQTFRNLSCLRLLDNDLRSMKQLERLRPLLTSLRTLYLGNNPVTRNTSADALRAWIKVLGPRISIMDLAPQQQKLHQHHQQQRQRPLQEQQRRGSLSSMPKLTQAMPTQRKAPSTHPPPDEAASRHHVSLSEDSNNVGGCFKRDAAAAAAAATTSGTTTHTREDITQEIGQNGKAIVEGETDATTPGGGGGCVSSAYSSVLGGGARPVPSLLGTTRADPFIAVERWPGCMNNNEYTIEAAGDIVLRSGAGATTAPSRSPTAGAASARRMDREPAGATLSAEATPTEAGSGSHGPPSSRGGARNIDLPAACTGIILGGAPMAADAAFARLVKARDRAEASAWGAVVLAGRGGSASGGGGAVFGGETGEARGGIASAWGASARAAKLACNGMVRRACEADRRYTEFGQAWEAAVEDIIQDVFTRNNTTTHDGGQGTHAPGSSRDHPEILLSCQDMGTAAVLNGHIQREELDRVKTHRPRARWLEDY